MVIVCQLLVTIQQTTANFSDLKITTTYFLSQICGFSGVHWKVLLLFFEVTHGVVLR